MRTALDTNILSAIWSNEPSAQALAHHLALAQRQGIVLISPFVYSECLAYPAVTEAFIQNFLDKTSVALDFHLHMSLWKQAGHHYGGYAVRRRRSAKEEPRRILADFLIGAHALLHADRLMTLDSERYQRDFPELRLYKM